MSPTRASVLLLLLCCSATAAHAQGEARTARYMEGIRNNPLLLRMFLREMPKGGDLHNHLSGAIYAESFLRWAVESDICIDTATLAAALCGEGAIPARSVVANPVINRAVIDAWSMRNWTLSGQSGHDHFFDTFGKFSGAGYGRLGDMLAESARRASANGLSYLELMYSPDNGAVSQLAAKVQWNGNVQAMRDTLLALGLRDSIRVGIRNIDSGEARMRALLGCGGRADNGCDVTIRYLYQVGRGGSNASVFAQILAGFEMAEMDNRVVGFNLVQPEDYPAPMANFAVQMQMINTLRPLYTKAHISLHAGEFAYGMVPPEALCCHIRQSIELGHAERIGHGVAVAYEDDAAGLLKLMAARKVLVEICLSSNDVILGVRGTQHPFHLYSENSVPLALATDDEGVSRSDITNEYARAVQEQGATYPDLKRMARNSIDYAFLPPSDKARLRSKLDQAFAKFEARW